MRHSFQCNNIFVINPDHFILSFHDRIRRRLTDHCVCFLQHTKNLCFFKRFENISDGIDIISFENIIFYSRNETDEIIQMQISDPVCQLDPCHMFHLNVQHQKIRAEAILYIPPECICRIIFFHFYQNIFFFSIFTDICRKKIHLDFLIIANRNSHEFTPIGFCFFYL